MTLAKTEMILVHGRILLN